MVTRKFYRYALLTLLIAVLGTLAYQADWSIINSSGFSVAPILQNAFLAAIGGYLVLFLLVIS
ncbi:MAG: hypothetical protein IT507_15785, partial [Burkholderiaceae bacterium]|nr:hypothetical protein [Burkholderiaceae bacterium]